MREKSLNESKCTVALTNKVKQFFPYGGVIVSVVITQHGKLKVKAEGRPESLKSECLMLRLGTMADLLNYVRYFKLNALIQCLWNLITRLERKLRLCFKKTEK